jgi:metal-sulfur cluster biosynthetic enzyme
MTDTTTTTAPHSPPEAETKTPTTATAAIDPQARATELAILDALRAVVDPEIGMNVVELALIRQVILGPGQTEIKMILTTPFCPWAGELIQTVKTKAEEVVGPPVKVTLLADRWEPPPGLF